MQIYPHRLPYIEYHPNDPTSISCGTVEDRSTYRQVLRQHTITYPSARPTLVTASIRMAQTLASWRTIQAMTFSVPTRSPHAGTLTPISLQKRHRSPLPPSHISASTTSKLFLRPGPRLCVRLTPGTSGDSY